MGGKRSSLWRQIRIEQGCMANYDALARFHYRAGRPRAVVRVLVARFGGGADEKHPAAGRVSWSPARSDRRVGAWESGLAHATGSALRGETRVLAAGELIGVLVETRPVLNCRLRNIALPGSFSQTERRRAAEKINRQITTIARVIVDPRFRGIGVAAALVRHCLRSAKTPCVEALAALGRHQPFFQAASMTRYDQPLPPEHARLLAALQQEGIAPADFAALPPANVSPFLATELLRFTRPRQAPRQTRLKLALEEAARRLLSWPAYFLWQNPKSKLPPPAPPPIPAKMPEALTLFLLAAGKKLLLEKLKRIHPDPATALQKLVAYTEYPSLARHRKALSPSPHLLRPHKRHHRNDRPVDAFNQQHCNGDGSHVAHERRGRKPAHKVGAKHHVTGQDAHVHQRQEQKDPDHPCRKQPHLPPARQHAHAQHEQKLLPATKSFPGAAPPDSRCPKF